MHFYGRKLNFLSLCSMCVGHATVENGNLLQTIEDMWVQAIMTRPLWDSVNFRDIISRGKKKLTVKNICWPL